ncbi:hypothetical protein ACFQ08_31000 [Streptosporangium algeriense]|uniref:Uncharacterized protein n=1 Tax=Streptosporangium algeriense TaxID=1682748 RepID=A0ABW3E200_9ACTN
MVDGDHRVSPAGQFLDDAGPVRAREALAPGEYRMTGGSPRLVSAGAPSWPSVLSISNEPGSRSFIFRYCSAAAFGIQGAIG